MFCDLLWTSASRVLLHLSHHGRRIPEMYHHFRSSNQDSREVHITCRSSSIGGDLRCVSRAGYGSRSSSGFLEVAIGQSAELIVMFTY